MALSRREIAKDVAQQSVEAAIATAGHVAVIFFDAARRITTELGSFGTEIFEITEASRRAGEDADHTASTHPDDA